MTTSGIKVVGMNKSVSVYLQQNSRPFNMLPRVIINPLKGVKRPFNVSIKLLFCTQTGMYNVSKDNYWGQPSENGTNAIIYKQRSTEVVTSPPPPATPTTTALFPLFSSRCARSILLYTAVRKHHGRKDGRTAGRLT
jgi:hypothetical protein